MPHAVFIRDVHASATSNFKMLAYGIQEEDAKQLIWGIATSFAEFGHETSTGVYWYRDRHGLHEIWAWPTID